MKTLYTLPDIEESIAYWSAKERASGIVLGPKVRILADVLGSMVCKKQTGVSAPSLSQAQIDALDTALAGDLSA